MTTSGEGEQRPLGMGLDLSNPDQLSEDERYAFSHYSQFWHGEDHPGFTFWVEHDRPGVLKRYRAFADRVSVLTSVSPQPFLPFVVGYTVQYALSGYVPGIHYELFVLQRSGLSKSQILEALSVAFLWVGPRGMETVAIASRDFDWSPPGRTLELPAGWNADGQSFKSGLDFTQPELTTAEGELLYGWYMTNVGEIPAHIPFLRKHRPDLLKAYRNRFENCISELPRQLMPYVMLQLGVQNQSTSGAREGLLLGKHWGMGKVQALEAICWGMIYGGVEVVGFAAETLDDLLDDWDE